MNCKKRLKSVVKICNPRFKLSENEKQYQEFQDKNEKRLLTSLTVTATILILAWTVLNIAVDFDLNYTIIRAVLFVVCVVALIARNRLPAIQRCALILVCYTLLYTIVESLNDYEGETTKMVRQAFLVGNMTGFGELMFVFTLKKLYWRIFTYVGLLGIKIGVLWSKTLFVQVSSVLLLFPVKILVGGFLHYNDRLDRKNFRQILDSKDKLQKFQDLISYIPFSLAILSSDFESLYYSNQLFQERFRHPQQTQGLEPRLKTPKEIFKQFLVQSKSKDPEITLYEFFKTFEKKKLKDLEGNVLTLFTTLQEENMPECFYEVKMKEIVWENKASFAIILNDVSDKQMIIGLKHSDEQKDRVIAAVSHELRTPINGILGLLQIITARIENDEVTLSYLENCRNCSKLLLHLVNSILDLSQIRNNCLKITKEWHGLTQILEEIQSLYIFQSNEKGIDFIIEKDKDVPEMVYTDKYRLTEILVNLLSNAMKFTFQGYIHLRVSRDPETEEKLRFIVTDSGIGIKDEDKPKLFKMFGKLHQDNSSINSQGVGLGLTISNELVKVLNDGDQRDILDDENDEKIRFDSEYGKGTTFWFKINVMNQNTPTTMATQFIGSPRNDQNISGELSSLLGLETSKGSLQRLETKLKFYNRYKYFQKPKSPTKGNKMKATDTTLSSILNLDTENRFARRVILVDDNPFNLLAAEHSLKNLGFNVTKAYNGEECLRLLQESEELGKQYHLILTDIQMPVMDGLEMSKNIQMKVAKKELYEIPIIALTAKVMSEKEVEEYRECGISYVLGKPLVLDEIKKTIDSIFSD